ncbi:hypothetical protein A3D03_00035 [Candidatus Gottesmanbacteria bacterium RIFCSPHIGHO2_02_FULL_40_13]|uniref:Big-1 domain-containing protein n=1 Tax=Candidatus Gottesmanbacteria bacterium RIFCSPHIGHO2_02_FULL_40_13 TaxID=1798384 RepID=A0A1F6A826_9BACT|nr:MAG: hypothetical protein A3D03_00035 [Candidatus Gottesmanbacteria bacterium RIFCSPHIGHO2_02_FULL_40_13]
MKDKAFISLVGVFFFLFVAAIGIIVINNPTSNILRAKNSAPSPQKSFVIVYPQVSGIASDANSSKTPIKIKVSVYLRDVNGNIVPNRPVKISTNPSSTIISPSDTASTNEIGMAEFSVSSMVPGEFALNATDIESNMSISNIPTLEFTE